MPCGHSNLHDVSSLNWGTVGNTGGPRLFTGKGAYDHDLTVGVSRTRTFFGAMHYDDWNAGGASIQFTAEDQSRLNRIHDGDPARPVAE